MCGLVTRRGIPAFGGVLLINGLALAQVVPCELAKLNASDGAAEDRFARSVAVSGETVVIGAYYDDDNGDESGSADVFYLDGVHWVHQAKLLANDGAADDYFGFSVAVSGDTIAIGAPWDDDDGGMSGSAYVFRNDGGGWSQQAKLRAGDGDANDWFGYSIAIDGETVVVGAHRDEPRGADSGSAYVFRFDGANWVQQAKLVPADGATGDWFGFSVAVSGDTVVVGSPWDDDNGERSGSAYAYQHDGSDWVEQDKLVASDYRPYAELGISVAVIGDTALIGAHYDGQHGYNAGAAYVFAREGSVWSEEQKLLPDEVESGDRFGICVALSGGRALAGAWFDGDNGYNAGAAYVFQHERGQWAQRAKLLASDGQVEDYFGRAVALSGDTALIGAFGDDDGGAYAGSAYVFDLTGPDCNENGLCDARDIAEGASEDCNTNGVPDECDVADGTSDDINGNGIPDECECIGDLTGDGDTDQGDLGVLLGDWGCTGGNCEGDLDNDGDTDQADLGILLGDWACET